MKIHLVTAGNKMDSWVEEGYKTYAKRIHNDCQLILHSIPIVKRSKSNSGKESEIDKIREEESQRLLHKVPKGSYVIALDVNGADWSTLTLVQKMDAWMVDGRDVSLLVGGPDGLSESCKKQADCMWSLSPATLPHTLVRIIVAEQLYRAWSIRNNHPYHR